MPTALNPSTLYLQIDSQAQLHPDELDELVRQLRRDLAEQEEVVSVDLAKEGTVPAGAKSAEVLTLGSLAIAVLPTFLPKLIEFLQNWLLRGENRRVKVKLQMQDNAVEVEYVSGATSAADVERLVSKLTGAMSRPGKARTRKSKDLSPALPQSFQ